MTTNPLDLWSEFCTYTNGLACGSSIAALAESGILSRLQEPVDITRLAQESRANSGFLQVALRLLTHLGWFDGTCLTAAGRHALQWSVQFRHIPALLALAEATLAGQDQPSEVQAWLRASGRGWDLPADDPVAAQVRSMLDGHLILPTLVAARLALPAPPRRTLLPVLFTFGLIDGSGQPTPKGLSFLALTNSAAFALRYIPNLRQVPELLFGDAQRVEPGGSASTQVRIDYESHLRGSGSVFTHGPVRAAFMALFATAMAAPETRRPVAVVDLGCGDGAMLAQVCKVSDPPLLAVGTDIDAAALKTAGQTLSAAGLGHHLVQADIDQPDQLAAALAALGLDPYDALYICKSVIHNRPYRAPRDVAAAQARTRVPNAAFVARDGSAIPGACMQQNLVEFFERWRPYVARHGFWVVEAHTVAPEVVALHRHRSIIPTLDATHCYSLQYVTDMTSFHEAAHEVGLRSAAQVLIGEETLGHAYMSIDHFVAT